MTSKIRSEIPDLKQGGANREEIMHRAYDSFDVQLTSIQLLFCRVGKYTRHYLLIHFAEVIKIRILCSFSEAFGTKHVRPFIFLN